MRSLDETGGKSSFSLQSTQSPLRFQVLADGSLMLSIGGPIVISLFLLIINGSHYHGTQDASDRYKLEYTWRILMGIGIIIPLSVFYFR